MNIKKIKFILLSTLIVCLNSNYVLALDATEIYINPATLGRESIDSFRENAYDRAEEDNRSRKDRLKMNQSANAVKYNLDATKTAGPKSFLVNKIIITGNTKISERRFNTICLEPRIKVFL